MLKAWCASMPEEWGYTPENMTMPIRGAALPMAFNRQPHYTKGLLLVGDAGGMVNPFNGEGIAYAMESGQIAADVIVQAHARATPAQRELALNNYPKVLKETYGAHRAFVKLIGNPKVMKVATQRGLTHPLLMKFTLKMLANLTDPTGGDAMDRIINGLSKVVLKAEAHSPPLTAHGAAALRPSPRPACAQWWATRARLPQDGLHHSWRPWLLMKYRTQRGAWQARSCSRSGPLREVDGIPRQRRDQPYARVVLGRQQPGRGGPFGGPVQLAGATSSRAAAALRRSRASAAGISTCASAGLGGAGLTTRANRARTAPRTPTIPALSSSSATSPPVLASPVCCWIHRVVPRTVARSSTTPPSPSWRMVLASSMTGRCVTGRPLRRHRPVVDGLLNSVRPPRKSPNGKREINVIRGTDGHVARPDQRSAPGRR
ncbi:hypothetical protein SMICM304S_02312 [Streptomyces microflavus]